jgi:hypothetical protein
MKDDQQGRVRIFLIRQRTMNEFEVRSAWRGPPPPPLAPRCKLARLACSGPYISMPYVISRVCKRAREFCKLASAGTSASLRLAPRPCAPRCKLARLACSGPYISIAYVIFQVCKRAREFCKLGLLAARQKVRCRINSSSSFILHRSSEQSMSPSAS